MAVLKTRRRTFVTRCTVAGAAIATSPNMSARCSAKTRRPKC
ncbi:twin-arginine translocation signal domain-containing protein [Pseudomonas sp. IT-347P]